MGDAGRLDAMLATSVALLCAHAALGAASLLFLHSFRPFAYAAPVAWLLVLAARHRRDLARPGRATGAALAIALALLVQAAALHAASIHIGRDEGVYAMQAWTFAIDEKPGFDDPHRRTWMGVDDAEGFAGGAPIFPPAYAVLLATGFAWGGDAGAHLVDGALCALAALLVFAIVRRLAGERWALLGALLFGTLYATWWFSRKHTSESLVVVLVLGSALLLLMRRPALGALPVAALLLTRVEAVLLVPAYALAVLLLRARPEPRAAPAWAAAAVVLLVAGAWSATIDPGYVTDHLRVLTRIGGDLSDSPDALPGAPQRLSETGHAFSRAVAWGLAPMLLLVATALVLVPLPRGAYAFAVLTAPGWAYLLHPSISPDEPFFFRRYHGILLPSLCVLAPVALAQLPQGRPARAAAVAGALLVAVNLVLAAPIATLAEWRDLPPQLATLADATPDDGALLLPPGQPGGFAAYLEMRLDVPSVYMRSVPPGLPPGSPMTLDNWRTFVPPGTQPILVSEIGPERLAGDAATPYVENDALAPLAHVPIASERLHRTCDLLGAFYGNRTQPEHEACAPHPPWGRELWRLDLHLYRVVP